MRELNECTAEVFRRSEKRIKERRKTRNRVLAFCIPLCLIVTVWSVMILPEMLPAVRDNAAESENFVPDGGENEGSSLVCSYIEVEIQDVGKFPEHYEKVTDQVEVTKIFSSIHSLFGGADGADQDVGEDLVEEKAEEFSQQMDSASRIHGFRITFSTEDGSQTVYSLSNNTLLNVSTDETVILTDAQTAELKEVLGISE